MAQKTYLKIPRERIGVLIGPKGRDKKRIEDFLSVILHVDSESGAIEIALNPNTSNISTIFTVRNIVKAIGRGFSPKRAMILSKEDYDLHVINLTEYVGTSKNSIARVRGRIIGKNGRSRELLEELTETYVSVYGDTVSYIGGPEALEVARVAIMMLIEGAFHKSVWNFLYAYRRKKKKEQEEIWYENPEPKAELKKNN